MGIDFFGCHKSVFGHRLCRIGLARTYVQESAFLEWNNRYATCSSGSQSLVSFSASFAPRELYYAIGTTFDNPPNALSLSATGRPEVSTKFYVVQIVDPFLLLCFLQKIISLL